MKNTFSTFMLIAAAALTFTSCNKETIDTVDDTVEVSPVTLHITADAGLTKSVFGDKVDGAYSVKWTADKQVAFSLNETTPVGVYPEVINEGAGASFDVTFTEGGETGTVYAFSPMGVYDNTNPVPGFTGITAKYDDVYLNIPSEQTPLANSCDQSAQALFASQEYNGSDTEINMTFSHVVAYGKMAVKNFTGIISKVDIVFPVAVCGTSCYYYYDGEKKGTIEKANINTITLNPDYVVDNVFWFACAPTAGATGSMKVIVTDSDDKTYTKTIDLTAKALPFTQGKVSSFGVDMTGIEADGDTRVIPDGDYVILAKDGDNYYAVSTDANANSARRDRVSVTYNGGESFETTNSKLIWSISANGNTFNISNDGNYMTKGQKTLSLAATGAADINIADNSDGTYTLTVDDNGTYTTLAMNGQYGFAWYASSTGINKLYIVPATYAAPTLYKITVNATTNGKVLASKDEAEAGETISITVTPDTGYQLDALTYNGNDIKEAKSFVMPAENVTISASFIQSEGTGELNTWTYEVVQTSPTLSASSTAEVEGATWSIVMGDKVGSPTANGAPTKYSGIFGWKWGDSGSKYWKSYTLSTDYFASKKVKSVTVNILNNGTKTGTMTVMQGSTIIGTASANFGQNWTNLTANAAQGTSGTLTIEYTVAQASYLHSITIEYYD